MMRHYVILKEDVFGKGKHGVLAYDSTIRPYDPNDPKAAGPLLFLAMEQADYYARNVMQLRTYQFHILRVDLSD